MLASLSFEGTTKVRNKGVDAVIVSDSLHIDTAYNASRPLVVLGISTAVLEVTEIDPIDSRTLAYYIDLCGAFVFLDTTLYDAIKKLLKTTTKVHIVENITEGDIIKDVRKLMQ